jgi:hypothetical protein
VSKRAPHAPEPPRATSPFVLARRVLAFRDAWAARDEEACRTELRLLAQEAGLLSVSTPLFASAESHHGDRR